MKKVKMISFIRYQGPRNKLHPHYQSWWGFCFEDFCQHNSWQNILFSTDFICHVSCCWYEISSCSMSGVTCVFFYLSAKTNLTALGSLYLIDTIYFCDDAGVPYFTSMFKLGMNEQKICLRFDFLWTRWQSSTYNPYVRLTLFLILL